MKKIIHWFRRDLRIYDNPALHNAAKEGLVLPVYILDDTINLSDQPMGSASKIWLHYSLKALNQQLSGNLIVIRGKPIKILEHLTNSYKIDSIYWNNCYEPLEIKRDRDIRDKFESKRLKIKTYNASLLWEPWNILKSDGTYYRVFTAFYRNGCLNSTAPRIPLDKPKISYMSNINFTNANDLKLLPKESWDKKIKKYWNVGEDAALKRLNAFLEHGLKGYKEGRNFPSKDNVSRLSPYLHFGEISPNYIWYKVLEQKNIENFEDIEHFCSELAWREFSYYLLYHFPSLPTQNLNSKFDDFPWREDSHVLKLWKKGKTGIPIVDAGMRELWETGYMHNRVRMIVASFLIKNLLIDWRHGEKWFRDCLVDADLANNSASWQWVAGCGADAAPYFRIFNPVLQGKKFDPEGLYVKKFVPELKKLPVKYLFNPWDAPAFLLENAEICLGKNYPKPIVDLKESRQQALEAFFSLKEK